MGFNQHRLQSHLMDIINCKFNLLFVYICSVSVIYCLKVVTGLNCCSSVCQCYDSVDSFTVHCINKGLNSVPVDIPDNVTNLDLSMNSISSLNTFTFRNSQLRNLLRLDLRMCQIKDMQDGILGNLVSLEELHLDQNKLYLLSSDTFQSLSNLKILSLNNNDLIALENNSFNGLRLDHLNLNDNEHLFEMGAATFFNSNVEYLSLDRCSLSTISVKTLQPIQHSLKVFFWSNSLRTLDIPELLFDGFNLDTLHLSHDGITNVLFLKNTNVVHLDLSGNPLGQINLNFAETRSTGLQSTEYLSLKGCHLKTFQIGSSKILTQLQQLDLSHNRLTSLQPRTFLHTRLLTRLDLTANLLQTLSEMLFRPLNGLEYMDISTNPLICDCRLEWLRKRAVETKTGTLITGAICHSPVQMTLAKSVPLICQSPNIKGCQILPTGSSSDSRIKVCCDVTGSPKPDIRLNITTCIDRNNTFHTAVSQSQSEETFHKLRIQSLQNRNNIDAVGSDTWESCVEVDLLECCVIECKASSTEGEMVSTFHTCNVNNTDTTSGIYYVNGDTNSDPSGDTDVPLSKHKHKPWFHHVSILICIALIIFVFIAIIVSVLVIWYKQNRKKSKRWRQLSPSLNRRGRDNYPAAVGLITSEGSCNLDCDLDDTDIHAPL